MLKVTMLGTGSAFSKRFRNTSALVEFESGYKLLIDCGHTVPLALHELKIPLTDIDGIFITHLHADHIGGLEEVALTNMYVHNGRKMDLYVPINLDNDLWRSLKSGLHPGGFRLSNYFRVNTVFCALAKFFMIAGVECKIYQTSHINGMISYAIGFGSSFFWSGDTVFDPDLIYTAAEKYKVIFHDCQVTPKGGVHASLEEMLLLPEDIQNKVKLMHYGDTVDEFLDKSGRMDWAVEGASYFIGGEYE